jgi:hypothetical protein
LLRALASDQENGKYVKAKAFLNGLDTDKNIKRPTDWIARFLMRYTEAQPKIRLLAAGLAKALDFKSCDGA